MVTCNSLDILISLIKACQDDFNNPRVDGPSDYEVILGSADYILGQIVRNLYNRTGHRCVSKQALKIWNKLKVGDSIFNYWNQKKVYYKNDEPIHLKYYKGAKSVPELEENVKFNKEGDSFKFRDVFHIEHIVPIKVIVKQLLAVDLIKDKKEVYHDINCILDKIYVCYITKEEDRKLNKIAKMNRSDNYLNVINTIYKKAGIEIAEFQKDKYFY